jgi:hypothetical protein
MGRKENMKFAMNLAALAAALRGDLKNATVASTPGGIEAQEAQGQKDFCASASLPKNIHGGRQQFEEMGIKFLDDADDIFVNVELPPMWKVEPTDHSMWNTLVDEKGNKVAEIFYKAAFYDRSAFMHKVD